MTYEETRKLLRVIYLKFPSTWAKFTKEEADELINLWYEDCRDFPYQGLYDALRVYQLRNEKYPPQSGELINIYLRSSAKLPSAEDSYVRVQKAVSNSGRNSVEEFNKLSFLEKRIISSPSELKQYADDETGAFTRYKRTYINRYNELLADPLFFKEMAKEMNKPQISVETKSAISGEVETKLDEIPRSKRSHQIIHDLIDEFEMDKKLRKSKGLT